MKGFKGFDKNLCCRGFQYEVGKTYEMKEEPILCERGFHFCETLEQAEYYYPFLYYYGVLSYYSIIKQYTGVRFCEIEAIGKIVQDEQSHSKLVTNKIKIVRELSPEDIFDTLWGHITRKYGIEEREIIRQGLAERAFIQRKEVKQ